MQECDSKTFLLIAILVLLLFDRYDRSRGSSPLREGWQKHDMPTGKNIMITDNEGNLSLYPVSNLEKAVESAKADAVSQANGYTNTKFNEASQKAQAAHDRANSAHGVGVDAVNRANGAQGKADSAYRKATDSNILKRGDKVNIEGRDKTTHRKMYLGEHGCEGGISNYEEPKWCPAHQNNTKIYIT